MRAPLQDHGAQGGARIFYHFDEQYTIYLLLAYTKATKADLTAFELKMLSQLVVQLRGGVAMDVFDELSESRREAIEIKEGKRKLARALPRTHLQWCLKSVNNSA